MEKVFFIDVVFIYLVVFWCLIFLELGGFDISFFVVDNEDIEFFWCFVGVGYKIVF